MQPEHSLREHPACLTILFSASWAMRNRPGFLGRFERLIAFHFQLHRKVIQPLAFVQVLLQGTDKAAAD